MWQVVDGPFRGPTLMWPRNPGMWGTTTETIFDNPYMTVQVHKEEVWLLGPKHKSAKELLVLKAV